jgi:hypothetical protein
VKKDWKQIYSELEQERTVHQTDWDDIAFYLFPYQLKMIGSNEAYSKIKRELYFSDAGDYLKMASSSLMGMVANSSSKWFSYSTTDGKSSDYLDKATAKALDILATGEAGFYSALKQAIGSLLAFGNAGLFQDEQDEEEGGLFNYRAELPNSFCFTENFSRNVEDIYFIQTYTGKQVKERNWKITTKQDNEKIKILRVISKNPYGNIGDVKNNKPYYSAYIDYDTGALLEESGFDYKPLHIGRWETYGNNTKWGVGIGLSVLPTLKQINYNRQLIRISEELRIKPPLFADSESNLGNLNLSPGAINFGKPSSMGLPLAPIVTVGSATGFEYLMQLDLQTLKQAFFIDVFQTIEQVAGVTATEVNLRNDERRRMLAPQEARIQKDFLIPVLQSLFVKMADKKVIDPIPKELLDKQIKINFYSPIASAQRSLERLSYMQFLGDLATLGTIEANLRAAKSDFAIKVDFDEILDKLRKAQNINNSVFIGNNKYRELKSQKAEVDAISAAGAEVSNLVKGINQMGA